MPKNPQPRADAFTRRVLDGQGPRTVMQRLHWRSGRVYFTRVSTQDCGHVHVRQVTNGLRNEDGDRLDHSSTWALDWRPDQQTFSVRPLADAAPFGGVRVGLTVGVTGRGGGYRLWLTCPDCGRRCAALYASPWTGRGEKAGQMVTGCRACLGLTDAARQRHKCQDWAWKVTHERDTYGARTAETVKRAGDVRVGGLRTLAGRLRAGVKPGNPQMEAQLDGLIAVLDEWKTS